MLLSCKIIRPKFSGAENRWNPPFQTINGATPRSLSDERNPVRQNPQQILVLSSLHGALTHGIPASWGLLGSHVGHCLNYIIS